MTFFQKHLALIHFTGKDLAFVRRVLGRVLGVCKIVDAYDTLVLEILVYSVSYLFITVAPLNSVIHASRTSHIADHVQLPLQ